jgi:5'-3' exonuclease
MQRNNLSMSFGPSPYQVISIIQNTPINTLAIPNQELSINQMAKLDKSKPVILVDTSYWLYYRFFALRNWYTKAFPDIANIPNFNMEHNWLEDVVFMNKYKKLFIENLRTLCRSYKTVVTNIVFCLDCSYKDIWRNAHIDEYKGTRQESLKKKQFNSFNVFSYIKKDYLPELQVKYGVKILYNNRCEADDIIGKMSTFLVNAGIPKVIIIANDNDYQQICNERVIMNKGSPVTGYGSSASASINSFGCIEDGNRILIRKILLGDISDNIKCCAIKGIDGVFKNVTKSNICVIMDNADTYNHLLELLTTIRTIGEISSDIAPRNFYKNCLLMDFQMIPKELQIELESKFKNLIF